MPAPFILGQDVERRVALTGWIGTDPDTGSDVAHLLLTPTGNDIGAKMRRLAHAYQLADFLTGEMPAIDPGIVHATLDSEPVVRIHPGADFLHRAVTADWAAAARARGQVVLTIGERALRYDYRRPLRAIDKYFESGRGLHTGLIDLHSA